MQTLAIAENSNADLKKKLAAKEQARKSADLALEGAEREAESQRKLTHEANDQLAASKEQVATLRKQLEETQRLRDQAEKARAETTWHPMPPLKSLIDVSSIRGLPPSMGAGSEVWF